MIRQRSASTENCFECDRQASHWHHVVPTCLGGHRRLPLCDECHAKVHSPSSTLFSGLHSPTQSSAVQSHEAKFKSAPRRLLPVLPRVPGPLGYAKCYPPQVVV